MLLKLPWWGKSIGLNFQVLVKTGKSQLREIELSKIAIAQHVLSRQQNKLKLPKNKIKTYAL